MSYNDRIALANITHQLGILQLSNGIEAKIVALVTSATDDLRGQILAKIKSAKKAGQWTTAQSLQMLVELETVIGNSTAVALASLEKQLSEFALFEHDFQLALWQSALGKGVSGAVGFAKVSPELLQASALATELQGKDLREWFARMDAAQAKRLRTELQLSAITQESVGATSLRLRRATNITIRDARTMARSSLLSTTNGARDALYKANADVISFLVWLATLDERTTSICMARDGMLYTVAEQEPVEHGMPWFGGPGRIHMQCRSTSSIVLKSWKEMKVEGLTGPQRASMDGAVPAKLNYEGWLRQQSQARQDRILGPTRGIILRENPDMRLAQLVDSQRGDLLNLRDLALREDQLFSNLGREDAEYISRWL